MHEDWTHFRVNLAQKIRNCKKDGNIPDSQAIYGKIKFKGPCGHVKIVNNEQELQDIAQS